MLFKLSNLNSNLALTLGYLNLALNNSAQGFVLFKTGKSGWKTDQTVRVNAFGTL